MEFHVELRTDNIIGRQALLNFLYTTFANETPGTANDTSRYTYVVETIADGSHIYLRRPAPLNNGIDFTVNSEAYVFRVGNRNLHKPAHDNIFSMLGEKRRENESLYDAEVKPLIQRIFDVQAISDSEYRVQGFADGGYPIELILKLLKWLFAEQDATYWNHSGRNMLMSGLLESNLA